MAPVTTYTVPAPGYDDVAPALAVPQKATAPVSGFVPPVPNDLNDDERVSHWARWALSWEP